MSMTQPTSPKDIRPPQPPGAVKWARDNLFNNWFNAFMSLVLVPGLGMIIYATLRWAFTIADWTPVVQSPLLYAVGQYPREELWRLAWSLSAILFLVGVSWGKWGGLLRQISTVLMATFAIFALLPVQHEEYNLPVLAISTFTITMRMYLGMNALIVAAGYFLGGIQAFKKKFIMLAWGITPLIILGLVSGFGDSELLPEVTTTLWGGLLVTFLLAVGGIVISFPIGLLLALGRQSNLPVVKGFSITFIETVRGVPLVTILFMFSFILSLLLPPEARIDRIVRALMAVTVFSAAYSAENIRGGLAAIPEGQIEAAKAVGMNGFQTMVFIVLPQAIRAVIPAIVGQFISLFKDTTLVVIVGINDFLGIGRTMIQSRPEFMQLQFEVYLFVAAIYMIFSYLMSMASRRLEGSMGVQQG